MRRAGGYPNSGLDRSMCTELAAADWQTANPSHPAPARLSKSKYAQEPRKALERGQDEEQVVGTGRAARRQHQPRTVSAAWQGYSTGVRFGLRAFRLRMNAWLLRGGKPGRANPCLAGRGRCGRSAAGRCVLLRCDAWAWRSVQARCRPRAQTNPRGFRRCFCTVQDFATECSCAFEPALSCIRFGPDVFENVW